MEGNDEKRARSESNDDEVVAKRHREEEEEQLSQDAIDLVDDQELLEEPLEDPVFGALAAVQNELELVRKLRVLRFDALICLHTIACPGRKEKAGQSRFHNVLVWKSDFM